MIDTNLLKSYKEQCGDEIIEELLFCFNNEVPGKINSAFEQLNSSQWRELKGTLHALKNSFLNVGASVEGSYCQYLEDQVEQMQKSEIQSGLQTIENHFQETQKDLGLAIQNL